MHRRRLPGADYTGAERREIPDQQLQKVGAEFIFRIFFQSSAVYLLSSVLFDNLYFTTQW